MMYIRKINLPKIFKKDFSVKTQENITKFLLVGNPNTGKTTLFNSLTRSNEHVGNWHGVTVSEKEKIFQSGENKFFLVDLPGLYSLTPLSYEEEVASEYVFKNSTSPIINICDINNLKRNLFLTLQLQEMSKNVVVFVNTFKKITKKDENLLNLIKISEKALKKLNIKYFIGNAECKKDVEKFKEYLNKLKIDCGFDSSKIKEKYDKNNNLNYVENNSKIFQKISSCFKDKKFNDKVYGASKLDKILLNKFLALPIFFGILLLVFYLTFFSLGAWLSDLIGNLIQNVIGEQIVSWIKSVCDVAWIVDLVETGIIGGVGSVFAFLPQVILLFLFLSLIEDSGYLARVAFLFEDIFAKIGLSGKSVYSLLMGFGCSTTASLTARNMEDKNAKIKTALLTPYMSCSAKLPIYAVIGGAFFGLNNIFIIFGLYMLGVVVAILLSLCLEKRVLKSKAQSFILEFPPYRVPSFVRILKILWENVKLFLIRIGTIIFALNIVVWFLQSFSFGLGFVKSQGGRSMLETIGGIFAPIFAPLGFGNWGATSALVAGLVAKEVVVSSIAMFNGINAGENLESQTMRSIIDPTNVVFFTPASAISFMTFCLLYSPCLATISVFKKEIGRKWTWLSIVMQFAIAYVVSFIAYRIALLAEAVGGTNVFWILLAVFAIAFSVFFLVFRTKSKKNCNGKCENCKTCGEN